MSVKGHSRQTPETCLWHTSFGACLADRFGLGRQFHRHTAGPAGFPPLLLAALRYLLALLPAVVFVARPATPRRYWIGYGPTSVAGQFGCLFYAMHIGMPADVASVALQSQAFFTILLAAPVLGERITHRQIVGMLVAGLGLYLVCASGDSHQLTMPPLSAFALGCIEPDHSTDECGCTSAQSRTQHAQSGRMVERDSPGTVADTVDGAQWIGFVEHDVDHLELDDRFRRLLFGLWATLFAFETWSRLLANYPAAKIAPLSRLVPVTGLLTAHVVLDEILTLNQWIGYALIMFGLIVCMLRRRAQRAVTAGDSIHPTD